MPVATAYIPNIYNIYIPIYSSILRVRYVVAMNSYRIKILLIYLCGYYENNENILQYTTVYYQNTIFSTTWSYGKEGNLLINILYLFLFQGYWELLHIPLKKSLHYFSSRFPQLYGLLELLDSERMVGHGTPIKDNTYLNIPEKEFSISIAYFSQNLHFVFHSKFEFPSMMEADLCNKFLSAHRQAAQKIINMRIQDKVRSASIQNLKEKRNQDSRKSK